MMETIEKETALVAQTDARPATPAWQWCPNCKLASLKAGKCPGCDNPYVAAPAAGVPDAPHTPKVRPDRTRRAMLASVAGIVALVAGIAVSLFLLATHGSTTVDSGDVAAGGSTVDGQSSFGVASLHGSLHLQGAWGTANSGMQRLQLAASVTGGAALKTELSVSKGGDSIIIESFASNDPSSVLNQFVSTAPQTTTDGMGNKITVEPSRDVSIAGYTAVAQDVETRNGKGGMVSRGTLYAVSAGERVVVIRVDATAAHVGDLATIEQALVNIG